MRDDGVKGHLDLLLLSALAKEPGHGYAVIKVLQRDSDGAIDLAEGLVYPALHRLEDAGLVTSDWTRVDGRRRREYRLTARGSKRLVAQRDDWLRLVRAMSAIVSPRARATIGGVS